MLSKTITEIITNFSADFIQDQNAKWYMISVVSFHKAIGFKKLGGAKSTSKLQPTPADFVAKNRRLSGMSTKSSATLKKLNQSCNVSPLSPESPGNTFARLAAGHPRRKSRSRTI